jgi:hypothetical protein
MLDAVYGRTSSAMVKKVEERKSPVEEVQKVGSG